MIKSMALIAVVLGVVPFLLGLLFTRFVEEEKNNLLLHMASGYMIMFGLFEVIALPLIWQRQSLSLLIGIYGSMLIVLSVVFIAGISMQMRTIRFMWLLRRRRFLRIRYWRINPIRESFMNICRQDMCCRQFMRLRRSLVK